MQKFYSINYNLLQDIIQEDDILSKDSSNYTTRGYVRSSASSRIINTFAIAIICTYFQKVSEECTFTFSSHFFKNALGCKKFYGYFDCKKILQSLVNINYTCMHVVYDYYTLDGTHIKSKNGIKINYNKELLGITKEWINYHNQLVIQSYKTYEAAYTRGKCKQYQLEGDNVFIGADFFEDEKFWNKLVKRVNKIFGHDILEEKEEIVLNVYKNAKVGLSFTKYYQKHSNKFEKGEFARLLKALQEQEERAIQIQSEVIQI